MMNKEVAIVLGGTAPHKALIEKLKKKGYYTILIDYLDNPPAAISADKHLKESALDYNFVFEIAKTTHAKLILSIALDQQLVTACMVAEKIGLPTLFSSKTALEITNKEYMKRKMYAHGIPTARFTIVNNINELQEINLQFPVMLKPVDNCGSAGVKRINSKNELRNSFDETLKWSRSSTVIVEEYVQGREISVYAFVKDKKTNLVLMAERFTKKNEDYDCIKCFATLSPARLSHNVRKKIQMIADKIADVFHLENTPMFYQFFVNEEDVSVIEFSARLGGGISFRTIETLTKFDIMDATIKAYLNEPIEIKYDKAEIFSLIQIIYALPCCFDHIEGINELIEEGIVKEIHYYKTKGAKVSNDKPSSARIAAYLITADTIDEIIEKSKFVSNRCEVFSSEGDSVMEQALYLKKQDLGEFNET